MSRRQLGLSRTDPQMGRFVSRQRHLLCVKFNWGFGVFFYVTIPRPHKGGGFPSKACVVFEQLKETEARGYLQVCPRTAQWCWEVATHSHLCVHLHGVRNIKHNLSIISS